MRPVRILSLLALAFIAASCSGTSPSSTPTAGEPAGSTRPAPAPSASATPREAASSSTPEADPSPFPTLQVSAELPPPVSPTACAPVMCAVPGHFLFARPIAPPGRTWVDPTYRYGSTQNGAREPHSGVEFLNSSGTPVLAAADGEVIVAGDDLNELHAEYFNFYGNLVILQHQIPEVDEPVFTLYGHLSEVRTEVGAQVAGGEEIGRVGFTGIAVGSHLHFEVRVGENTFESAVNPELWLDHRIDPSGLPYGALAGRVTDWTGETFYIPNVVLEYIGEPGDAPQWEMFLETYAAPWMRGTQEWGENFGVTDLPGGWYRITFVARGLQVHEVKVEPGMLTVWTLNVDA